MLIANQNLIIKEHFEWFPNTSFPSGMASPEWIQEQGYYLITAWKPYNHATEKLVPAAPHLYEGMCCTVEVAELTEEELQSRIDSQWQVVRTQRNQLLAQSDWTQLADTPVDKTSWATYRQELRDITAQPDPFNIVWPEYHG
jgi:hypothetical protein